MGTHSKVLSKSYLMNTNMTWFRWFSKIFAILVLWTNVATALEGFKWCSIRWYLGHHSYSLLAKQQRLTRAVFLDSAQAEWWLVKPKSTTNQRQTPDIFLLWLIIVQAYTGTFLVGQEPWQLVFTIVKIYRLKINITLLFPFDLWFTLVKVQVLVEYKSCI